MSRISLVQPTLLRESFFRHFLPNEFPSGHYEQFIEVAQTYLSKELEEEAMTIAQQLKQQGIQQGLRETALRMLERKLDIQLIAEVTKLSPTEIESLKKKKD